MRLALRIFMAAVPLSYCVSLENSSRIRRTPAAVFEGRLYEYLFHNQLYDRQVLPVQNWGDVVDIDMLLRLYQLITLVSDEIYIAFISCISKHE